MLNQIENNHSLIILVGFKLPILVAVNTWLAHTSLVLNICKKNHPRICLYMYFLLYRKYFLITKAVYCFMYTWSQSVIQRVFQRKMDLQRKFQKIIYVLINFTPKFNWNDEKIFIIILVKHVTVSKFNLNFTVFYL